MINIVSFIKLKQGRRSDFLEICKANLPNVRSEKGCIEYFPAIDTKTELPEQKFDENIVTILEKWESKEALYAHIKAPHMLKHFQEVQDMIDNVSIKILTEA